MRLSKLLWHTAEWSTPWFWSIGVISLYRVSLGVHLGIYWNVDPKIQAGIDLLFFSAEVIIRPPRTYEEHDNGQET